MVTVYYVIQWRSPSIIYHFCFAFISAPCLSPTWKFSRKFSCTGRSLRQRRTSLVDTIVVKLFTFFDSEWASAGSVLQHLHNEQKQAKLHITLPSLTGPASHLHSDQTSWATKQKSNRGESERKLFIGILCQSKGTRGSVHFIGWDAEGVAINLWYIHHFFFSSLILHV